MARDYRNISLGFTEESFPEGHHIVFIYNDDWERKRTMAKFLQRGLSDNEKVLYLVDDISPDEMKLELLELGVDVDEKQKDFDITRGHYALCPGNYFSGDYMLSLVGNYYDDAISEGFSGARGAGEMSWALVEGRATIPDLLRYEAELNKILLDHPLTTVCQYDARRFDGAVIMDMLSVHPMMIVRGQLVKNPSYVPPELFLREYNERLEREKFFNK
ncbi:MAG: MEDS domain-containing protein [Spirochaetales bacterium]|nr:MEDS domain-containing protein [Spirochaetales bacterium]